MELIYKGQTMLSVKVDTNIDLTGATILLKYIKPNGDSGSFNTGITLDPDDINNFFWTPQDVNSLDVVGEWTMWAHVSKNGKVAAGKPFCVIINEEGTK